MDVTLSIALIMEAIFVLVAVGISVGVTRQQIVNLQKENKQLKEDLQRERDARMKLEDEFRKHQSEGVELREAIARIGATMEAVLNRLDRVEKKLDAFNRSATE